ncbi:ABC transporter ATP-binding protein [Candidatus Woesearchaeota archaeon]|nr:ABC transporter ATP-binding protein [Candidatus Woesearchaeota archaeon]
MEVIQLKEVSKEYNKATILEHVNLLVEQGDIIGIIGQSGSGKTTLLNLIAGFVAPSSGEVVYFSKIDRQPKNLNQNFSKIKKHLGFTPQRSSFYPKLSIKENLIHFGQLYGLERSMILENAKNLLQFTGLYEHRDKLAEQLSGGMQRRLDISCSLVHKPKILFLDEPMADLDPIMQEGIIQLIQEVNKQGVTVIIASHHLESVERLCSQIVVVRNRTIKNYAEVDELRKPFLKDNLVINIKAGKEKDLLITALRQLPISKIVDQGHQLVVYPEDTEGTVLGLLKIVKKEDLSFQNMDLRKPSLNEIFPFVAGNKL